MDPKKVRKLRKLVEALVRKEIQEINGVKGSPESKSSKIKFSVGKFFDKLEKSPIKSFLDGIDDEMEKKQALAHFAKLIGFDPNRLPAVKTAMKP